MNTHPERLFYLVIFVDDGAHGDVPRAFIFDTSPGLWDIGRCFQQRDEYTDHPEDESANPTSMILMASVLKEGENTFRLLPSAATDLVRDFLKDRFEWEEDLIEASPDEKFGGQVWYLNPVIGNDG